MYNSISVCGGPRATVSGRSPPLNPALLRPYNHNLYYDIAENNDPQIRYTDVQWNDK
jgi:hypothetical protein